MKGRLVIVAVLSSIVACGSDEPAELPWTELPVWVYEIEPGDSLSTIAERFRVPGGHATLAAVNGIASFDHIEAGQRLLVPSPMMSELLERYVPLQPAPPSPPPCPDLIQWPEAVDADQTVAVPIETSEGRCLQVGRTCAEGPGGTVVCQCGGWQSSDGHIPDRGGATKIVVFWADGGTISVVDLADGPLMTSRWQASTVDLDGDGVAELLFNAHILTSNGISLDYWQNLLFSAPEQAPISFWSVGPASVVALGDDDSCQLQTRELVQLTDQLVGPGNYFLTRRFAYRDGRLVPGPPPYVVQRLRQGWEPQLWPWEVLTDFVDNGWSR